MWIKQIFMAMVGFSCGLGVAGGLFALIIALGLVAEFADQTHTAKHIFWYEDAVAAGGILGNVVSVYQLMVPVGRDLSILLTVAVAVPLFPASSSNSKVKLPFLVKVWLKLPFSVFVTVTGSEGVMAATTSPLVGWVVE